MHGIRKIQSGKFEHQMSEGGIITGGFLLGAGMYARLSQVCAWYVHLDPIDNFFFPNDILKMDVKNPTLPWNTL